MAARKSSAFLEHVHNYRDLLLAEKYMVIDVETRLIDKTSPKSVIANRPEPLMYGYLCPSEEASGIFLHNGSTWLGMSKKKWVEVMHNCAFDLMYFTAPTKRYVWDTMIAEYLLSNQVERSPSLERLAEIYGIQDRKLEEVSEQIKAGVCPGTIPVEELKEYLRQDLLLTDKVFKCQMERFRDCSTARQNMIINQMFWRVNTLQASLNGLAVNEYDVDCEYNSIQKEVKELEDSLVEDMQDFSSAVGATFPYEFPWNPRSTQHVSAVLYGGPENALQYTIDVRIGTYKTGPKAGTAKYKKEKVQLELARPKFSIEAGTGTDEKQLLKLKQIASEKPHYEVWVQFIDGLLKLRDLDKTGATYYKGYVLDMVTDKGLVHGQFNHALTPTGRITSSKPNLQNLKG